MTLGTEPRCSEIKDRLKSHVEPDPKALLQWVDDRKCFEYRFPLETEEKSFVIAVEFDWNGEPGGMIDAIDVHVITRYPVIHRNLGNKKSE